MTFGDTDGQKGNDHEALDQKGGGVMVTTQEDRLQMAIERLVSNGPAIVEALRQAGYWSLALQTEHDFESLAHLGTGAAPDPDISVPKMEVDHDC